MAVKRTIIVEPVIGQDGELVQNRAKAEHTVLDFLGFLWSGGGAIRIVADRVLTGELPVDAGRKEPYGETVGLVIEFDSVAPLNRESITAAMMDQVYGAIDPGEAPAAAAAPDDDDAGDEVDDDDDGIGGIIEDEED